MAELVATADLPPNTWVGARVGRKYLLRADGSGWLWPWFHQNGRWEHTLHPAGDAQLWTVRGPAGNGEIGSLNDHVRHIPAEGCGAMGWCGYHPKRESR